MVTQKLISFKVDSSQLELIDSFLPLIGIKRNDFINRCLSLVSSAVKTQIEIALSCGRDIDSIPFLSE